MTCEPEQPRVDEQSHHRRVRVLVVDDYPDNAESMGMLLRFLGHEVATALDGSAALEAARDRQPDVVLLDISMAEMNGYEVARQLRRMFQDQVLLIAITAHGFEEDRQRCLDAGFDRHVVKPADPNEIQRLLGEMARLRARNLRPSGLAFGGAGGRGPPPSTATTPLPRWTAAPSL
jgi:CheY-like chemotaxis protein